jgi:hypothetical protein
MLSGIILASSLTISCSTIPSGLELVHIDRVAEPKLSFQDTGEQCISTKEATSLAEYFINVRRYQDTSDSIVDALNDL